MTTRSRNILISIFLIIVSVSLNGLLHKAYAHQGEVDETVIHMTETGYEPQGVDISPGGIVVFENVSETDLWPASNIHPTHQIYPNFDPQQPISKDKSWSFVFEKPGEWKYHDHLHPTISGTIKVNQLNQSVQASSALSPASNMTISSFEKLKLWIKRRYYQLFPKAREKLFEKLNAHQVASDDKQLRYYLNILGGEAYMSELIKDSGGGSIVDCHQEAHTAGRVAYELFGGEVFKSRSFDCHSGYIHGAMEAFLKDKGTQNLATDIPALCDEFETRFTNFECLHGVGHGVIAYENYDLEKAIEVCKSLSDWFGQSSCFGGNFMENILLAQGQGASQGHETKWVNDDPHFPCNKVDQDDQVQFECYQMQTSWMLTLFNYDFDKVAKECLKARIDLIPVCFKSFGRDAAGQVLRDPQKIVPLCDKVPKGKDYYDQCIAGALNVLVDFWGDKLENQATDLCRIVIGESKQRCYSLLAVRLDEVFPDPEKKRERCNGFEAPFANLCGDI